MELTDALEASHIDGFDDLAKFCQIAKQEASHANGFDNFGKLATLMGLEKLFLNSLIIHQEKTKKITTVTVVWICDPNYHKILPTLALNFSKNY